MDRMGVEVEGFGDSSGRLTELEGYDNKSNRPENVALRVSFRSSTFARLRTIQRRLRYAQPFRRRVIYSSPMAGKFLLKMRQGPGIDAPLFTPLAADDE